MTELLKRWWVMSEREEEGSVLADSDQEAEATFRLCWRHGIFPADSFLIAEEEEIQDEDILSTKEITT